MSLGRLFPGEISLDEGLGITSSLDFHLVDLWNSNLLVLPSRIDCGY